MRQDHGNDRATLPGERARRLVGSLALIVALGAVLLPLTIAACHAVMTTFTPGWRAGSPLVAFALTGATLAWAGGARRALCATGCLVALLAAASFLANLFFDLSMDGMGYHQEAILGIGEGRALWEDVSTPEAGASNHFPRFAWYYSAAWLALTGNIHLGKSLNILLPAAAALMTFCVLRDLRSWSRYLATAAISLNPIMCVQWHTHYVDTVIASFTVIGILGLVEWSKPDRLAGTRLLVALAAVGCATTKFTGLAYGIVILAGLATITWSKRRRSMDVERAPLAATVLVATLAVILSVDPYVSNVCHGRHALYPAFGEARGTPWISGQTSEEFFALSPPEKLVRSVFAATENSGTLVPLPTWKVPFTVSADEWRAMGGVDTRWAGWGPLFGGALLLCVALVCVARRHVWRHRLPLAFALLLCAAYPDGWWARHLPHLHTVTALLLALVATAPGWVGTGARGVMLVLLTNSALVSWAALVQVARGNAYVAQTLEAAAEEGHGRIGWTRQVLHFEPLLQRLHIRSVPVQENAPGSRLIPLLGETIQVLPAGR